MIRNSPTSTRIRVCAVSYLNTVPLVWGMLHGNEQRLFDLSFCVPSECAERLSAGSADIGIVPVVELPRQKLEFVRGCGIGCRGPVRSILLISKTPPEQIRTLAADLSSRTSVVLSRVVLAERYGAEPKLIPHAPELDRMLSAADAALIIGDPALRIEPTKLPYQVLDLGAEWTAMTGLPMVFAVWAGRKDAMTPEIAAAFCSSCRFGLDRIDEIVSSESARRGVAESLARQYLTSHIAFELGEKDYEGMELFLRHSVRMDRLISSGIPA